MCLLAVLHRVHPGAPLVVAANRDEWLDRASAPLQVLRQAGPRVLGGRDLVAGGTWLALNEHGVVAGLTNKPAPAGPDPEKRSRGELPLELARHSSASEAAESFRRRVSPRDYNPCWLLVGDGRSLHYLDLTRSDAVVSRELEPGIHVLENRPLEPVTAKAALVASRLERVLRLHGQELVTALACILGSHDIPGPREGNGRPPEAEAACVHAGRYGTRSATIVVTSDLARNAEVYHAEGPPCSHEFTDSSALWRA